MSDQKVFSKEDLQTIERMASTTYINDICEYFGISNQHFRNLRKFNQEIEDALNRGFNKRGPDFYERK